MLLALHITGWTLLGTAISILCYSIYEIIRYDRYATIILSLPFLLAVVVALSVTYQL